MGFPTFGPLLASSIRSLPDCQSASAASREVDLPFWATSMANEAPLRALLIKNGLSVFGATINDPLAFTMHHDPWMLLAMVARDDATIDHNRGAEHPHTLRPTHARRFHPASSLHTGGLGRRRMSWIAIGRARGHRCTFITSPNHISAVKP